MCVSQVQRIAVKRSHWDSDQYQFDQAFPAPTSQKRLYEEFCAPVVDVRVLRPRSRGLRPLQRPSAHGTVKNSPCVSHLSLYILGREGAGRGETRAART